MKNLKLTLGALAFVVTAGVSFASTAKNENMQAQCQTAPQSAGGGSQIALPAGCNRFDVLCCYALGTDTPLFRNAN